MNASAIADVIRRVAENQAEQFKVALAGVRKDCEASIAEANRNALALVEKQDEQIAALKSLVEAKQAEIDSLNSSLGEFAAKTAVYDALIQKHAESTEQHNAAIDALRNDLNVSAEIKALEDLLLEEREKRVSEVAAVKSLCEQRLKEADQARTALETKHAEEVEALRKEVVVIAKNENKEVLDYVLGELQRELAANKASNSALEKRIQAFEEERTALEQKHAAEIQALRETAEDRSHVEVLEKEIGSLKDDLAKSREASEAADAELRTSVESVVSLGKALSESAEEHKAELAKVVKSLEDMPEIPELPPELADLAEVVKGMVGELADKVALIEKMASGFMHFRGTWDEETTDYTKGASVVCKNSLWVATRDNDLGNPGDRDSGWQLCIKSGKVIAPYEHR